MVKNKVLILGGCGFIGSNLSEYLTKKKYRITVTYFKKKIKISKDIKYIKIDLTKKKKIKDKLKEHKFDFVVNCAGYINHSNNTKNKNIYKEHTSILHNVTDYFKNGKITRFINFGTSDEYGNSRSPQNEGKKSKPLTLYALSKTYSNLFLKKLWKSCNFPSVTLRLFLVYGPRQSEERLIPYVIQNSLRNNTYKIFGGNQIKDFCFINDLCEAVVLCFKNEKINGQVINIASGKKTQIKKIVNIIKSHIKKGHPNFEKKIYRKSENIKLWADIKKAKKILGWKPKTSLSLGIKKTVFSYL